MEVVTIQREPFKKDHTYGALYWHQEKLCDTIEPPWKENIKQVSCIPAGVYTAKARISPKNGDVWELQNTAPRQNIQIHAANVASELLGCVAVGKKGTLKGVPAVLNSKRTMEKLKKTLPQSFILVIKNG